MRYRVKTDRIRDMMKERGLSQREAAEMCGVARSAFQNVLATECGTLKMVGKIARGFCVEPRYIAIFPRNRKTAEAGTPAVDTEQVCIENTLDDTTTMEECQKQDLLYFFEGEWRTEKRLYELLTIDKLVELLNLPVIAITRVR